jgi:hypothetical protein
MPMMQMPRAWTVRTKSGHTIKFKKDTPVYVPDDYRVIEACQAAGAMPTSDSAPIERPDENTPTSNVPKTSTERLDRINAVLKEMAAHQGEHRQNFTAYGRPNTKYVSQRVGVDVSAKEVESLWNQLVNPQPQEA